MRCQKCGLFTDMLFDDEIRGKKVCMNCIKMRREAMRFLWWLALAFVAWGIASVILIVNHWEDL